ncbi:rhodanese-related sulfurtransferase [Sphingobium aquiterrae]|uniref:oxygen-dependent tRNA uridine(34) hydroxylase TrhO n=1 Tax=Sphingobium aquiterrae TaxID=2038656 RepID=UPI003018E55A
MADIAPQDHFEDSAPLTVAALYRFTALDDPAALHAPLLALCEGQGVRGTLLLAHEGLNGTIAGPGAGIDAVIAHLRTLPGCAAMEVKYATATTMPFGKMKVRLKREIVTMGVPDLDPVAGAGIRVEPEEWNALIADPDTVVIDTRNNYEIAIGSFANAVDPHTATFRNFPAWFDAQAERWAAQGRSPRIAMFCTGGIRCEKATAYVRDRGFEDVHHLNGGILRYLEQVPPERSLWQGDCFVFDDRVSVGHGLRQGDHAICQACGWPVAADNREAHAAQCAGTGAWRDQ